MVRPYSRTTDRMIAEDLKRGFSIEKVAKIYNRDITDLKKHIKGLTPNDARDEWHTKDPDKDFEDLYIAIFKNALKASTLKVKALITYELKNRGHEKSEIRKFIDESEVEKAVKEMVYKEAQDYPLVTASERMQNERKICNRFVRIFFTKSQSAV